MHCSRSGGITPSSPTPTKPPASPAPHTTAVPNRFVFLHAWISFDSLLSAMSGLPQLAVGVKSASHRLIGNLGRVHLAGLRKRRHGNRLGPSELPDEAAPE